MQKNNCWERKRAGGGGREERGQRMREGELNNGYERWYYLDKNKAAPSKSKK